MIQEMIAVGVVLVFILIVYSQFKKQSITDTLTELKEFFEKVMFEQGGKK